MKKFRFSLNVTYGLYASVVIGNEVEEFLSEKGNKGGGSLRKSQHLLQDCQHALPMKIYNTISLNNINLSKLDKIKGRKKSSTKLNEHILQISIHCLNL